MADFDPTSLAENWYLNPLTISIVSGTNKLVSNNPARTSLRIFNTTSYGIYLSNYPQTSEANCQYFLPANSEIHFTLEKDGGFVSQAWYALAFNAGGYLFVLDCSFRRTL